MQQIPPLDLFMKPAVFYGLSHVFVGLYGSIWEFQIFLMKLTLRTDLVGFLRVPGHHDGEHLATAFLYIIDRICIASNVRRWPTVVTSHLHLPAWLDHSRQHDQQRHIYDLFRNRV